MTSDTALDGWASCSPTPIAELRPDIPEQAKRIVRGEVGITWPYSKAAGTFAFMLGELDVRLRRSKGLVKVQLRGACAEAIAKTGLCYGDEVVVCLEGAKWTESKAQGPMLETEVAWQLEFTDKLSLQAALADTNETIDVQVDHHRPRTESPLAQGFTTQTADSAAVNHAETPVSAPRSPWIELRETALIKASDTRSIDLEEGVYISPAFIKRARVSYGSLFEGGFDPFEGDGSFNGKARKRTRLGRGSTAWRYTSESRSPTPEPESSADKLVMTEEMHEKAVNIPRPAARVTCESLPISQPARSPPHTRSSNPIAFDGLAPEPDRSTTEDVSATNKSEEAEDSEAPACPGRPSTEYKEAATKTATDSVLARSSLFGTYKAPPTNLVTPFFGFTFGSATAASSPSVTGQVRFSISHEPQIVSTPESAVEQLRSEQDQPAATSTADLDKPDAEKNHGAKAYTSIAEQRPETDADDAPPTDAPVLNPELCTADQRCSETAAERSHGNRIEGGQFRPEALGESVGAIAEPLTLVGQPPVVAPPGFQSCVPPPTALLQELDTDAQMKDAEMVDTALETQQADYDRGALVENEEIYSSVEIDAKSDEGEEELDSGDYDQRQYDVAEDDDEGLFGKNGEVMPEYRERFGEEAFLDDDKDASRFGYTEQWDEGDEYDIGEEEFDDTSAEDEEDEDQENIEPGDGGYSKSLAPPQPQPSQAGTKHEPIVIDLISSDEDDSGSKDIAPVFGKLSESQDDEGIDRPPAHDDVEDFGTGSQIRDHSFDSHDQSHFDQPGPQSLPPPQPRLGFSGSDVHGTISHWERESEAEDDSERVLIEKSSEAGEEDGLHRQNMEESDVEEEALRSGAANNGHGVLDAKDGQGTLEDASDAQSAEKGSDEEEGVEASDASDEGDEEESYDEESEREEDLDEVHMDNKVIMQHESIEMNDDDDESEIAASDQSKHDGVVMDESGLDDEEGQDMVFWEAQGDSSPEEDLAQPENRALGCYKEESLTIDVEVNGVMPGESEAEAEMERPKPARNTKMNADAAIASDTAEREDTSALSEPTRRSNLLPPPVPTLGIDREPSADPTPSAFASPAEQESERADHESRDTLGFGCDSLGSRDYPAVPESARDPTSQKCGTQATTGTSATCRFDFHPASSTTANGCHSTSAITPWPCLDTFEAGGTEQSQDDIFLETQTVDRDLIDPQLFEQDVAAQIDAEMAEMEKRSVATDSTLQQAGEESEQAAPPKRPDMPPCTRASGFERALEMMAVEEVAKTDAERSIPEKGQAADETEDRNYAESESSEVAASEGDSRAHTARLMSASASREGSVDLGASPPPRKRERENRSSPQAVQTASLPPEARQEAGSVDVGAPPHLPAGVRDSINAQPSPNLQARARAVEAAVHQHDGQDALKTSPAPAARARRTKPAELLVSMMKRRHASVSQSLDSSVIETGEQEDEEAKDGRLDLACVALTASVTEADRAVVALKNDLLTHMREELLECVSLKRLRTFHNKVLTAVGIVTADPTEPVRAKGGPREYMVSFYMTDPAIAPTQVVEVQLYRPHKGSLPVVKCGDAVLLRDFKVLALPRKRFGLRTSEDSTWAVFDGGEDLVGPQIRGPPVEDWRDYVEHMSKLKQWFGKMSKGARAKIERANGRMDEVNSGEGAKM